MKSTLLKAWLIACALFAVSCSGTNSVQEVIWVGSTPGDNYIKSMLNIPATTKVDFIRWNLVLKTTDANENSFELDLVFGEGEQGTPGFKNGGETQSYSGNFTISKSGNENINGETWHLKSSNLKSELILVKLDDNLIHLLTSQNRLMIGNGGWSYTLSRKTRVQPAAILPVLKSSAQILNDTPLQVVFEGRTPCQEVAAEHPELKASSSCHKLKWRLILLRDSVSRQPTTSTIRKVVDNNPKDELGTWSITKGIASNPDAIIYTLNPDKPGESISFLAGDENVLFILSKKNTLLPGNADFSFTLNKK